MRPVYHPSLRLPACGLGVLILSVPPDTVSAQLQETPAPARVVQDETGTIRAGDLEFQSWRDYVRSDFFHDHGLRCGIPAARNPGAGGAGGAGGVAGGGGSDCTYTLTNPAAQYDPSVQRYRIPVVFHVIRQNNGTTGHIPESLIQSQVDVLNEDFLALAGSNGAGGTDIQVEFELATSDPSGNPTSGITYSDNTTWFNDGGSYWNSLAWDTNRYMNVYTNTAGGALGYVPDLPQGGIAGSNEDRVVVLWSAVGRNAPIGPPFNQGRTLTHEVGHYLGLEHTFNGGCSSPSACYSSGDLICDTNPQAQPTDGCSDGGSCSTPDPISNYMDYSDDTCMSEFTPEQARRMRCSLENYRQLLYEIVGGGVVGACCQGTSCTISSEDGCVATGGVYQGDNTGCGSNPCGSTGGPCGDPAAGDCAAANGSPGCSDGDCCETVCAQDAYCCDTEWDDICADAAGTLCDGGGGDGCPGSGDCFSANGTPGCDDGDCCVTVCGQDAFCCDVEWDALCAEAAAELCDGQGLPCVGDTNGDNEVNIEDLLQVILNFGPCPGCAADITGDGTVNVTDLIEVVLNWGPCV